MLIPVETGNRLVYRISEKEATRIKDSAADQALETIRNRIDQFGVSEPTIHRQAENEIVVQLPGVKDPKRAIELIGKTAQLEFKMVDDDARVAAELPQSVAAGEEDAVLQQFAGRIPEDTAILFEKKVNSETGAVRKSPLLIKKQASSPETLSDAKVNLDSSIMSPMS
jgi:preprotein translocase subunit SecD